MKAFVYNGLFVLVVFLIQTAGFREFERADLWFPQLVLLWMIIFALNRSLPEVVWFGFFAGFLSELTSGLIFGSWIFAILLVGIISFLLTRRLTAQEVNPLLVVVLVVSSTLFLPLVVYLYNQILSGLGAGIAAGFRDLYSFSIIWKVVSNLALFYPLSFLLKLLPKHEKAF